MHNKSIYSKSLQNARVRFTVDLSKGGAYNIFARVKAGSGSFLPELYTDVFLYLLELYLTICLATLLFELFSAIAVLLDMLLNLNGLFFHGEK